MVISSLVRIFVSAAVTSRIRYTLSDVMIISLILGNSSATAKVPDVKIAPDNADVIKENIKGYFIIYYSKLLFKKVNYLIFFTDYFFSSGVKYVYILY